MYHRRSIRFKNYDYSQNGAYFITICTKNRKCYFQKYKPLHEIIKTQWNNIPKRYPYVELDEYIIMPDHFHGIVWIDKCHKPCVGATFTVAQNDNVGAIANAITRAGARPAPTIGEIVGSFKSLCVNEWLEYLTQNNINELGKFWQRNYYERIIRNEKELYMIRKYIKYNFLSHRRQFYL